MMSRLFGAISPSAHSYIVSPIADRRSPVTGAAGGGSTAAGISIALTPIIPAHGMEIPNHELTS